VLACPTEVLGLVERFTRNRDAYRSPAYNETQARIDTTDRHIDELVYELYALTDDEIRIVEETTAG
jgi:hypothetical protein